MTRRVALAALALLAILPLSAGDVATFANLGFSPDSGYFMYGQYGIDVSTACPWAEVAVVDTKRNDFVSKGRLERSFGRKLEAGQSPEAALFSLFGEALPLAKTARIDVLTQGRLIYALVDGADAPQTLDFKDYRTGDGWQVSINKSILDSKESVKSSFGISIVKTGKDGAQRRVTAGNPSIVRQGVRDYLIRSIIVAPDEKTMVLVIEKILDLKGDRSVRYMVETLRLP